MGAGSSVAATGGASRAKAVMPPRVGPQTGSRRNFSRLPEIRLVLDARGGGDRVALEPGVVRRHPVPGGRVVALGVLEVGCVLHVALRDPDEDLVLLGVE